MLVWRGTHSFPRVSSPRQTATPCPAPQGPWFLEETRVPVPRGPLPRGTGGKFRRVKRGSEACGPPGAVYGVDQEPTAANSTDTAVIGSDPVP